MHHILTRRTLLASAATAFAGTASTRAAPVADRVRVAIMGLGGRGSALLQAFLTAGAEIAGLCDLDDNAAGRAVAAARKHGVVVQLGNQASTFGVSFHGPDASLVIDTEGWRILDRKNAVAAEHAGTKKDDVVHVADFLAAALWSKEYRPGWRPAT